MTKQQLKTLCIVESPSKAVKLAEYLGDDYIVKASKGHILQLASGGKHGLGVNINNQFQPRYVLMDDKIDLMQELMNLAANAKEVLLMPDPDREGLAIARHLYERLKEYNSSFKRITFTEISKKAIKQALTTPEDILSTDNVNMYHSQTARRVLDRLVGFLASPFLMNVFGSNLSAGRVQSCLVRFVVDREAEIDAFVPEDYWNIHTALTNGIDTFSAKYEGRITNQHAANNIYQALSKSSFVVSSVEATQEKKKPYPPLTTAKLQQIMSKRYGMDATRTMSSAQNLYEQGTISYHRTDSVNISEDAIKDTRQYLKEVALDIPKVANRYTSKASSQGAHECIRPTNSFDKPDHIGLYGDEQQVYDTIWRYFLASQMCPAIYDTLKVKIQVIGNPELTLVASGKALKYAGFLQMLGVQDDNKIDIPSLKVGDRLKLANDKAVISEKKQTQPSPRFSEATLIEILEKKGIGRPSTFATLLSTITQRNYVEKRGNTYYPTDLGKKITQELMKWFSFLEYNYTADLEGKLDDIAEGKLEITQMLQSFYEEFQQQLEKAYVQHGYIFCDKCKGGILKEITVKSGDKFWGCSNYSNGCRNTKKSVI